MARNILIVDDDSLLRRSLSFHLEQGGYQVHTAASAEDALAYMKRVPPDLVILDIGLPGMDGLDALRELKKLGDFPIIFLTARRRELDEVVGLELGADDYITKPFDVDVLLARVKVVLRRTSFPRQSPPMPQQIVVSDIVINPAARTVHLNDEEVELTRREFDLLYSLALQHGRVVPTNELLTQVWGAEFEGDSDVLYVHIRWLREKLEEDPNNPRRIVTVRGIGYKLN